MARAGGVGVILLLALCVFTVPLHGQEAGRSESTGPREPGFELNQNYPNPFNPSTRIPFVLSEELFRNKDSVVVSIRIYNVLQQLVAIPTALHHPRGNGVPVNRLAYTSAGRKEAFWDGLDREGRKVASGIYYLQLVVDGESRVRKMVVAK